ncbi:hypothetical protein ACJ4V0_16805 [Phreatobacter sp. HK31-P]
MDAAAEVAAAEVAAAEVAEAAVEVAAAGSAAVASAAVAAGSAVAVAAVSVVADIDAAGEARAGVLASHRGGVAGSTSGASWFAVGVPSTGDMIGSPRHAKPGLVAGFFFDRPTVPQAGKI